MRDLGELSRELREALQQQAAITARIETICRALEAESIEKGQSGTTVPYDEIVKEWNQRCATRGMKKRNTAGELKPAMLRVWRKYPDLQVWRAAFDACARNSWWRGEGGWQGTLESMLRPINYGKFFDEAVGAAPVNPSETLALGKDGDRVEEFLSEFLRDKAAEIPTGFKGKDPREVRGKDDAEFARRYDALRDFCRSDWRFA